MTEDTTIDRLLGMARDLAERQYPDDLPGRQAYHIGLLEQRIREIAARPIRDLPVVDRGAWYGGPALETKA